MGLFGSKPVIELRVEGMTCGHCVQRVTDVLEKAPGVKKVEVSLDDKSARVTLKKEGAVSAGALIETISEAGYKASKV